MFFIKVLWLIVLQIKYYSYIWHHLFYFTDRLQIGSNWQGQKVMKSWATHVLRKVEGLQSAREHVVWLLSHWPHLVVNVDLVIEFTLLNIVINVCKVGPIDLQIILGLRLHNF